jgi:hypothetical protein
MIPTKLKTNECYVCTWPNKETRLVQFLGECDGCGMVHVRWQDDYVLDGHDVVEAWVPELWLEPKSKTHEQTTDQQIPRP